MQLTPFFTFIQECEPKTGSTQYKHKTVFISLIKSDYYDYLLCDYKI